MPIQFDQLSNAKTTSRQPTSSEKWWEKDIQIGGAGLSDKKKERFFAELGILLTSGVDLRTGLELTVSGTAKAKDKQLFQRILDRVVYGDSVSDAICKEAGFTDYDIQTLRIGEQSGKMAHVLQELAAHYKRSMKQRQQMVSALSYPAIVLVVAIGAVGFMLQFVVPMFADMFTRFDGELPWITKTIMDISAFVGDWAWLGFLILTAFVLFIWFIRNRSDFKRLYGNLLLKIPLVGPLVATSQRTHFCNMMQLLMASDSGLLTSLELVVKMSTFHPMQHAVEEVIEEVKRGSLLHEAMRKQAFFPLQMCTLIQVGEEVNQLDQIFERLSTQYQNEVEQRSEALSTFLEPVMIIGVAALVAVILIAMYLPMFKLSTTMG